MEFKQAIDTVKSLIELGNLEEALQALVALCDSDSRCSEIGQAARVNQADFFQLKSRMVRGVVPSDEARIITNQLTDNALELLQRLERGDFGVENANNPTSGGKNVWRYYVAGGIVALAGALLIWRLSGDEPGVKSPGECPTFEPGTTTRVMLLPFQKENSALKVRPEADIADGITSLVNKTPKMRELVSADILDADINQTTYLSPAEAAEKARSCGVQMIIWGRISGSSSQNYRLRVNYRLLKANQILQSGDTTINRLVTVTDQGDLSQDAEAITRLIYVVLANQLGAEIPESVLASLNAQTNPLAANNNTIDTLAAMVLTEYYIKSGKIDKALAELDAVLAAYPEYNRARQTRAALLYEQGKYAEAADDLEVAVPADGQGSPELHKARIEINLKSGRIDRSKESLRVLDRKKMGDKWINEKSKEVQDSSTAMLVRLQEAERLATVRPQPENLNRAAELSRNTGNAKKAEQYANKALQTNPDDPKAIRIYVEANLQQKDTAQAVKKVQELERRGFNVKGILQDMPDLGKRIGN